jgi:hypothetical protein
MRSGYSLLTRSEAAGQVPGRPKKPLITIFGMPSSILGNASGLPRPRLLCSVVTSWAPSVPIASGCWLGFQRAHCDDRRTESVIMMMNELENYLGIQCDAGVDDEELALWPERLAGRLWYACGLPLITSTISHWYTRRHLFEPKTVLSRLTLQRGKFSIPRPELSLPASLSLPCSGH